MELTPMGRALINLVLVMALAAACQASTSEVTVPTGTAASTPVPTVTAQGGESSVAIDPVLIGQASAVVDRLIGDAVHDDRGIATLDECPSPTIETILLTTVPDRIEDEVIGESARWMAGADVTCIVTTAPTEEEGFEGSSAIGAYRPATTADDYVEDVAFHEVDDRSTVGIQRAELDDALGGSMNELCAVYDDEFGYCEIIWVHPDGLILSHWTTVIDDRPLVRAMRDVLVEAIPSIVADLAAHDGA